MTESSNFQAVNYFLDMVYLLFQVPNPRVGGNRLLDNPRRQWAYCRAYMSLRNIAIKANNLE